jgi:hypothetical protein
MILLLSISETLVNVIPLLPTSYPGRLASRNSVLFYTAEHVFITTLYGPRRKHNLHCYGGVFTGPLPSNGHPIFACAYVAGVT